MFTEARVHGFDTIWVTLWALLVITQSQTNLADDVPFSRHCSEQCATSSEVCRKIRENQPSQAVCHGDVRQLAASVVRVLALLNRP